MFSAELIKISILDHILIAKIEIVLEVSSPSPPTLQKNVNAVAVGKKEGEVGRGGIHCNRLYKVDEGKNNVAHRCEGGGEESTVPFFLEGRKKGGSQILQKRVHEFLIKKYRTIFPFFVPLMNEKLGFKTTNVKWLF